ncbi:MAG TPA: cobalt-precorrin-5B (C(1))-methyltransferase CbiD [Candidatus Bariatricus faecipullorum]|nr:cobalt-precorrin-5B (C(1))-methyltransferase CbiD [Candidatus Bariatricus faecipullorum]
MRRKLERGYTTGSCAQAAAKAALKLLLSGEESRTVTVTLANGETAVFPVEELQAEQDCDGTFREVCCGVRKRSGDDPDITDGILVYCRVKKKEEPGTVLEGGTGIGRVTKPGLEQPVGSAAINRVPRQMLEKEAREAAERYHYPGGLVLTLEIPGGRELAEKTFNPRLGIEGGLSVLGTTGIVEPMSSQALVDTIRAEIRVKLAEGRQYLVAAPGNYGLDFLWESWKIPEEAVVKCSNFIGETVDMAAENGARGILFVAHIGKFVKLAGGMMNTHSRCGDCRMELLAAAALRAGAGEKKALAILEAATTEAALDVLSGAERQKTMREIMKKIEETLRRRAGEDLAAEAMVFSGTRGILGQTKGADTLLRQFAEENRRLERSGE